MNYQDIQNEMIKSIKDLLNQYKNIFSQEEYVNIKRLQILLSKTSFSSLEEIKIIEEKLTPFFARIWEQELTNFDNFKLGDGFKCVIVCPTVTAEKFGFSNRDFLSGSLITDKHIGTFNKIRYAIACNVDENNLISVSSDDSHTVSAEIDSDIARQYFYTGTTQSGKRIYNKKYVHSLRLPSQVELDMIRDNIRINGDFIVQNYKSVYSDITLDPASTQMLRVILIEPCTEEDKIEAQKLAEKFGLKITSISSDFYHEKISIANTRKEKPIYDITDLDTLEFILSHLNQLSQQYSNLIFSSIQDFISIKDENQSAKLVVDKKQENMAVYLTGDTRDFRIDYKNGIGKYIYSIDQEKVTREEFQEELISDIKKNEKGHHA